MGPPCATWQVMCGGLGSRHRPLSDDIAIPGSPTSTVVTLVRRRRTVNPHGRREDHRQAKPRIVIRHNTSSSSEHLSQRLVAPVSGQLLPGPSCERSQREGTRPPSRGLVPSWRRQLSRSSDLRPTQMGALALRGNIATAVHTVPHSSPGGRRGTMYLSVDRRRAQMDPGCPVATRSAVHRCRA